MQLETTSSSQHLPAYLHWCPYIMSFLLLLLGSSAWAPIQDQLYPCGCEVDPILSYLLKDVSLAVLPTLSSFIDSFMAPPPERTLYISVSNSCFLASDLPQARFYHYLTMVNGLINTL